MPIDNKYLAHKEGLSKILLCRRLLDLLWRTMRIRKALHYQCSVTSLLAKCVPSPYLQIKMLIFNLLWDVALSYVKIIVALCNVASSFLDFLQSRTACCEIIGLPEPIREESDLSKAFPATVAKASRRKKAHPKNRMSNQSQFNLLPG